MCLPNITVLAEKGQTMPFSAKQIETLEKLKNDGRIHASNMLAKRNKDGIEKFYDQYMDFNNAINGDLSAAVRALNEYKNFVNINSKFSAQSKFESTIIEEFICQILKKKFGNDVLRYGSVKAYSSLYFSYSSKTDFKNNVELKFNVKDQDVAIYKHTVLKTDDGKEHPTFIPIVCIECKTYLDKTMYEGSVATASKIKMGNPRCLFFIVTETYEVASDVEIELTQIDNIYVLRKQRRKKKGRRNNIMLDVIEHLLSKIEQHINKSSLTVDSMIERGYLRQ